MAAGSLATFTSFTILPVSSTMQMVVAFTDTVNPTNWSMLLLPYSLSCRAALDRGDRMQFDQPNRREIITLVGGAAISWPLAARAQQPAKLVRIGVLASLPLPPLQRFSHKLREYGYVEGQNL